MKYKISDKWAFNLQRCYSQPPSRGKQATITATSRQHLFFLSSAGQSCDQFWPAFFTRSVSRVSSLSPTPTPPPDIKETTDWEDSKEKAIKNFQFQTFVQHSNPLVAWGCLQHIPRKQAAMCRFQDLVLNTLDNYSRCVVTVTVLYQYYFLYLPLLFSVPKIKRLLANQNCLAVTVIVGSKPVTVIVCSKPVTGIFANRDITLFQRPDQGGVGQSLGNSLILLSLKNVNKPLWLGLGRVCIIITERQTMGWVWFRIHRHTPGDYKGLQKMMWNL